ncbi:unnamed protein product [Allacma fusca]|uniref:C2H2-type domain-containing protein n=1 Tax=Allacma fusca TaxID=39272 RepID=A0A8J2L4N5_9HEXA|nr:unnamed protein product [Allacma fusca]
MLSARVWEAVETFNARTSVGRVVVNPPGKRGEVKAHPTLETWHFCKCGKAFSNPDSYVLHRKTHQGKNISLQLDLTPAPSKNGKKVEELNCGKALKKPLTSKVIIKKRIEKEVRVVEKPDPSPKKVQVVKVTPKGIKSIKGIRLHIKNGANVRPVWPVATPPQMQPQANNIHRCNQCEQVFILAVHLKAHIRLKHTPSLLGKVGEAMEVVMTLPQPVQVMPKPKPLTAKRLKLRTKVSNVSCEPCKLAFRTHIGYFLHLKVAHGSKGLHCCPHCPKKTLSRDTLHAHVNSFHKMTKPTSNISTRSTGKKIQEVCEASADSAVYVAHPVVAVPISNELKAVKLSEDMTNFISTRSGNHQKLPEVSNARNTSLLPRCKICKRLFYSAKLLQTHMIRKHNKPECRTIEKSVELVHENIPLSTPKSSSKKSSLLKVGMPGKASSEGKSLNGGSLFHDVVGTRTRSRLTSTNSSSISDPILTDDVPTLPVGSQADKTDIKDKETAEPMAPSSSDFTCKSCGINFETRRSLVHHTRESHPVENLLKCKDCSLQFTTANRLKKHSLRHTLASTRQTVKAVKLSGGNMVNLRKSFEEKIRSDVSTRNLGKSARQLKRPSTVLKDKLQDGEQKKRLFDCNLCGKKFSHFFSLSQHLKNHSSPFSCGICGTGFSLQANLDLHNEKAHFPGGQYACEICPCVYENYRGLASHVAHRHQTKLQANIVVVTKGKNNSSLVSEEDINPTQTPVGHEHQSSLLPTFEVKRRPQKPSTEINTTGSTDKAPNFIKCEICGCEITKNLYASHLKEAHVVSGKFHCPQCTCVFESRQSLSVHKRTLHFYSGNKSLMKPIYAKHKLSPDNNVDCSPKRERKETSNTVLLKETPSVNNCEWSSCTLCSLSIPGGYAELQKHLQIAHVNPSTFRCQHCSCSFRDRRSLVVHMTNVIHPVNDNPVIPVLITQNNIGTVQILPHFRPVLPQGTSITELSTTINPMEEVPCKATETSIVLDKKESTNELVEDSIPKIISYYSQNPEYIKKQSPQKSNESDVLVCVETNPSELGKLGKAIESEAKKLMKAKDIKKVRVTPGISISVVQANENDNEKGMKINGNSNESHGIIPGGLHLTNRGKSKRRKQKPLLPPPPTELATVSSEYQLPFALDSLQPITPEVITFPMSTLDRASEATTNDWDSWNLSKLLGTSNDDDDFPTESGNNCSTESPVSQKSFDIGPVIETDPLESVPVKSTSFVESKSVSQNKTRLATCPVCKKSFFNQQKLLRHIELHEDQAKLALKPGGKCGYCGQSFDVHAALWTHLKECRGKSSSNEVVTGGSHPEST